MNIFRVASLLKLKYYSFQVNNICLLQRFAGFFVTIWIAAVMFKSNGILRKQTALKVIYYLHLSDLCFIRNQYLKGFLLPSLVEKLSMPSVCGCRGRERSLFWLESVLLSRSMLSLYIGGIGMMIFCIHWWCFPQNIFHLSGMLFLLSWLMVGCFPQIYLSIEMQSYCLVLLKKQFMDTVWQPCV